MTFLMPLILEWRKITPWDENEGETFIIWWLDANKLGLWDPRNPSSNVFEIEVAREYFINNFEDINTLSEFNDNVNGD